MQDQEQIPLIKVVLSNIDLQIRGRPYRTIALYPDTSLYIFAKSILDAFGLNHDHMFGFYDNLKDWTKSHECYTLFKDEGEEDTSCLGVKNTNVGAVFYKIGKKMLFLFDYGEEWHFVLRFVKTITPKMRKVNYPAVIKSVGKSPKQYTSIPGALR